MAGLKKWFGEKWVDLSRPIYEDGKLVGFEVCGRKKATEQSSTKDYPKCRPLKAAMAMSEEERKRAIRRKRKAEAGAPFKRGRARAPVRVRTNPDDFEYLALPFPRERKPLSYRSDPREEGEVYLEDLIATQRKVSKAGVEKYLDYPDYEPIVVYQTTDGRQYIADGHHRAMVAFLRQEAVIPAVVVFVRE